MAGLLAAKYGALMSNADLADLLKTTERRISNGFANDLPWCRPFKSARIKLGRRTFLNTASVVEILEKAQRSGATIDGTSVRTVWNTNSGPRPGANRSFWYSNKWKVFWRINELVSSLDATTVTVAEQKLLSLKLLPREFECFPETEPSSLVTFQ